MGNVTDFSLDFNTYDPIAKIAESYLTLEGKLTCAAAGSNAVDLGVINEWLLASRVAQALLSHNPNVLLFSPWLTCSRRRMGAALVEFGLHCIFGRLAKDAPNGLTLNVSVTEVLDENQEDPFADASEMPEYVVLPLVSPTAKIDPSLVPVTVVKELIAAMRTQVAFNNATLRRWRGFDNYKNELFVVLSSFSLPMDDKKYSVLITLEIGLDYFKD